MIAIIDYGMGNLKSISNMIKKIGYASCITRSPKQIAEADKLILPGVGHFDHGMSKLKEYGLIDTLNHEVVEKKKCVLGICLGMQLMTTQSEEGKLPGLGWIEGTTQKFKFSEEQKLKIPHMGWNTVKVQKENPLFALNENEEQRFYFVHSYQVVCNRQEDKLATCFYGHNFIASFQQKNIFGVQFHPEKSHRFGLNMLSRFSEIENA